MEQRSVPTLERYREIVPDWSPRPPMTERLLAALTAAFAHPDRERQPLITLPTLVMADASDPLKTGVAEAAACIRGAHSRIFEDADATTKMATLERFLDQGVI